MCRSKLLGGRRCKCGSTEAARKRALDNRKKNRSARRNLASYFKGQEMNETAAAVMKMNPSAIPALLKEMNIDHSVLEVEPPSENRVAQDQRRNEQIIALALKEAEGKGQEQLLDTSGGDGSTPVEAETEVARGFAQLVIDSFEKDSYDSGIFESDNYERLEKLYPQIGALDMPDDEPEATESWSAFSDKIMREVEAIHGNKPSEQTQRIMDTIGEKPEMDTKPRELTNAEAREIFEPENYDSSGSYDLGSMLSDIRNDAHYLSIKDLGGGFYIYKYHSRTAFLYVTGEPGQREIHASQIIYSGNSSLHDPNTVFPHGLGLSKLSTEDKQELVRKGNIPEYLNSLNKDKTLQHCIETLRSELHTKPHVKPALLRDLRINHNYQKGNTFVHSNRDTKTFPPFSMVAFRNFVAGHVLTTEKTPVTKTFKQVYGKESINIYSKRATYAEKNESKRFNDSLNFEDEALIRRYTSNGYRGYARLAVGTPLEKEDSATKENLARVNELILDFSKTVEKPRTVLRGQGAPRGMTVQAYVDSIEVGQSITSTKLLSTSTKASVATENFSGEGNVVYVYRTKQGAAVTTISQHEGEREIILPAGADFVCVGKSYEGGQGVVYLADKDLVG